MIIAADVRNGGSGKLLVTKIDLTNEHSYLCAASTSINIYHIFGYFRGIYDSINAFGPIKDCSVRFAVLRVACLFVRGVFPYIW